MSRGWALPVAGERGMAPATVSPAQASTFRWEVSQPATCGNHLTHPAEWFRDVWWMAGSPRVAGFPPSRTARNGPVPSCCPRPSFTGAGFDPCGGPRRPPLASRHRPRRQKRAAGQWRLSHVTADVVALAIAFLCPRFLAGKEARFWGAGSIPLSSFQCAHDFLPTQIGRPPTSLCFYSQVVCYVSTESPRRPRRRERRFESDIKVSASQSTLRSRKILAGRLATFRGPTESSLRKQIASRAHLCSAQKVLWDAAESDSR